MTMVRSRRHPAATLPTTQSASSLDVRVHDAAHQRLRRTRPCWCVALPLAAPNLAACKRERV